VGIRDVVGLAVGLRVGPDEVVGAGEAVGADVSCRSKALSHTSGAAISARPPTPSWPMRSRSAVVVMVVSGERVTIHQHGVHVYAMLVDAPLPNIT